MTEKPYRDLIAHGLKRWSGVTVQGEHLMDESFWTLSEPVSRFFDESDLDPRYQVSWFMLLGMLAEIHYENAKREPTWTQEKWEQLLAAAYVQQLENPQQTLPQVCSSLIAKRVPVTDLVSDRAGQAPDALLRQLYFALAWAKTTLKGARSLLDDEASRSERQRWVDLLQLQK